MKWVKEKKEKGNELYRQGRFEAACQIYLEACVGLELKRKDIQQEYQLPLTCNMAACLMAMKQWSKVIDVCTGALRIDAQCVKARRRRGLAYAKLERFELAQQDLEQAVALDPHMQIELDKLKHAKHTHSIQTEKQKRRQKKMMQRGVGQMYADKAKPKPEPKTVTWTEWILSCCGRRQSKIKTC